MPSFRPPTTLEIAGYEDTSIPCALHRYGSESEVAVVFPGAARNGNRLGGTPARPDLHYTRGVLQTEGLAVFEVWWDGGSAPHDDLDAWLDANAGAALAAASHDHRLSMLVGRSLGPWALARLVSDDGWRAHSVPTVWLAPLLNQPPVLKALRELRSPAFVVGGGDDQAFDVAAAAELRDAGASVVVLEGANHGLEVDDPAASARLLADVLDELRTFVRARPSSP